MELLTRALNSDVQSVLQNPEALHTFPFLAPSALNSLDGQWKHLNLFGHMCLSCLEKLMFLGTAKLKTRGSFRWATRGGRANTEAAAAILKSQHVDYVPWTVLKKRVRVQGLGFRIRVWSLGCCTWRIWGDLPLVWAFQKKVSGI